MQKLTGCSIKKNMPLSYYWEVELNGYYYPSKQLQLKDFIHSLHTIHVFVNFCYYKFVEVLVFLH